MGEGRRFSSWESAVPEDNPVSNGRQGAHFRAGQGPGFKNPGCQAATWVTNVHSSSSTPVLQKEGRGVRVSLCPRVSSPYPSNCFWLSDRGEGVKVASTLVLWDSLRTWIYGDTFRPIFIPFPPSVHSCSKAPKARDSARRRELLVRAGRGPHRVWLGVLDKGVSVNSSPRISKNMAKKF